MPALFLDGTAASHGTFAAAVQDVVSALTAVDANAEGPFPMCSTADLDHNAALIDPFPEDGRPFADVIAEVAKYVLAGSARPSDPRCAAHLHPPTLLTAAAAELAIGVTNQSMDSFDQAPAATYVEDRLVERLATLLGLPARASGVMTAGGSASNLLALFAAREHASSDRRTIVTSDAAHVSVRQSARVLGLGRDAVVTVPCDANGRMDVGALRETLNHTTPLAVVATAGTTDAGAIDPLEAIADLAASSGAWLHVDAAVGAAFALSDKLRPLLRGLNRADSITADFHKLWWQPIGASALLVRTEASLAGLREPADYLNRPGDTGVVNLVDRSLDTSRRFDALKVVVSLRSTGRKQMAAMVEHLVDLAAEAARHIREHPGLELVCPQQTVTVLFRCAGLSDARHVDLQRDLLSSGHAVIGRTSFAGRVALKLTLVNPLATSNDLADLLDTIAEAAAQ